MNAYPTQVVDASNPNETIFLFYLSNLILIIVVVLPLFITGFGNLAIATGSLHKNPYLAREFTGSNFQPYITTINLYQKGDYDTPVIQATVPKAIRKSNKISTTFKIKLDI